MSLFGYNITNAYHQRPFSGEIKGHFKVFNLLHKPRFYITHNIYNKISSTTISRSYNCNLTKYFPKIIKISSFWKKSENEAFESVTCTIDMQHFAPDY